MRIVVETALNRGAAEYLNLGDVSMLQVAVRRLQRLWPSASISVLTDSGDSLKRHCPGAKPLSRAGRDRWIGDSFAFGRLHKLLPRGAASALRTVTDTLERHLPKLLRAMVVLRLRVQDSEHIREDVAEFLKAMESADLFVVCGAGGFTDSSKEWTLTTLGTLETAIRRNVPIAMFGQGIGPLSDADVLSRAKRVLPAVKLITLRGGRGGQALAESLGVGPSRAPVTGDEAVELAYESRPAALGHALGVNLRVASYAEVSEDVCDKLRPVLQDFARRRGAPILPAPIAFHAFASDHLAIRRILAGYDDQSDGGLALDTPLKVIEQVGRCRVVVTGAYHAAVFSLSQGVPVICLAASADYIAKFLGLEDLFGQGCQTLLLDDPMFTQKLEAALENAWQSADEVRLPLQRAAARQIELSWHAYERARDLVDWRGGAGLRVSTGAMNPSRITG
ncbi:MAG TPA: polysaccharide pyruvyl transferase family protein [Gemmatimonadales bacterium]|nr:polysaccharide pyruvyl transferase family protein [Gemmatimonadales bacterium]